jgi:hypothetical protein
MSEIKNLIDEIGILSFENNMKIAGFAVISDSRKIIYQTENWDVSKYRDAFFYAINGSNSIEIKNTEFNITKISDDGYVASSQGMGSVILIPFKGGVLATYALTGANPDSIIAFLKPHVLELQKEF